MVVALRHAYDASNHPAGCRTGAGFVAGFPMSRDDIGQGYDMDENRFDAWVKATSHSASRRALLGALAGIAALGVPAAAGARKRKKRKKRRPRPALVAQCLPSEGFVHVEITYYWAQTFVAERSGLLTRAVFELLWNEKADAAFEVALRSVDERGFPAGGNLAEQDLAPVPEVRTPDVHVLNVTFDTPARVVAGQRYALALFSSEGILPNNRLGDPCAGGTAFMYDEVADGWAIQNFDLRFAAYVKA